MIEAHVEAELEQILARRTGGRGELIPILQEAQEQFRYLPREVMQRIAEFLKIPESTVFAVGTFYAQFRFVPSGRYMVRVCRGTACHVRRGARILREVEKRLDINPGETTEDLNYSLETVACFGSCALSPVMVVDKTVYGRMTPEKVEQILSDAK